MERGSIGDIDGMRRGITAAVSDPFSIIAGGAKNLVLVSAEVPAACAAVSGGSFKER